MSTTTPYQWSRRGNLFIVPVGPAIAEVQYPTQTLTNPRDGSLWVRGRIEEPDFQLDHVRMPPSLFQEVRDDLLRYSPVKVSRSAFRRSEHAYVGVIDSEGTPYYFALDSRGISVRDASGDDRVWKNFDRLADAERAMALHQRRAEATAEMREVDRELRDPRLVIMAKSDAADRVARRYAEEMARASRDIASQIGDEEAVEREETELVRLVIKADDVKKDGGGPLARVSRMGRHYTIETSAGKKHVGTSHGEALSALREHLPHGFDVGGMVNIHQASVHAGAPKDIDPNAIHVMKPSEVAAHGVFGNKLHPEHVDGVRQAWGEGKRMDPIEVHVPPDGTWHVEDGNHRLHVAAGTDSPVALRFRAVDPTRGWQPQSGITDISQRVAAETKKAKVKKALPKKSSDKPVKKTPSSKATKKQAGAKGKTRYTYPGEKQDAGDQRVKQHKLPLVIMQPHDDGQHADPGELANQLGVSVRTLARIAKHFDRHKFASYMRSHLRRFAAKHRLGHDYWGTLHDALRA